MLNTTHIFCKTRNLQYVLPKYFSNQQQPNTKPNPYSTTVLLPKTDFPLQLKGNKLIERDIKINKICTSEDLYIWQRSSQRKHRKGEYVLHDGPPYANGPLHMGHAINKVLKDIVIRSKLLDGYRIHYKPGWDCHGLPIELQAISGNNSDCKKKSLEIREIARKFSTETIEKQLTVFKSWGVLGDWNNPYKTYDKTYIINQLNQFYKLYEKGWIYRDLKPVYWSPESRTALAEAELEYNENHVSNAIIVKFEIINFPTRNYLQENSKIFALTWTTTPWTLPSNQAIAFSSALDYSIIQANDNEFYIIASSLLQALKEKINLNDSTIMEVCRGNALSGLLYVNPLNGTVLPFLAADYVTADKGTGLVHTAPAHGPDDYLLALQYNIPIISIVDENGCYTHEAGPLLNQLSVLTSGSAKVIELLKDDILFRENLMHSYPYDWRTKTPVILRASKQWFLNTGRIKEAAAKCLNDVKIFPTVNSAIYRKTLMDQLMRRPYWCISRQRKWGVPIPVFYNKHNGLPVLNKNIISRLTELLDRKENMDFWFEMPANEILKNLNMEVSLDDIEKGEDILDIWFDSGISWSSVLEGEQIANMYLEGLDQFTGWFQSSLITSVCLRNSAPYKSIYVHGHALDQHGMKMSKSKGNVIDPATIILGKANRNNAYGVDTLRWWVACHASRDSAALVADHVIQSSSEEVQKLRAVLRFILGALADYKGNSDVIMANLHVLDKYILHSLWEYTNNLQNYVDECNFCRVCTTTINLATNQISSVYFSAIKDRLYCDEREHLNRLTAQFTLHCILRILLKHTAAILPHLCEDVFSHLPSQLKNTGEKSYFQSELASVSELLLWENQDINQFFDIILKIRREINRNTKEDRSKIDVLINISKDLETEMKQHFTTLVCGERQLELLFQVANVSLKTDTDLTDFCLEIQKTNKKSCSRCRRFVIESNLNDHLCNRCNNNVNYGKHKDEIKVFV